MFLSAINHSCSRPAFGRILKGSEDQFERRGYNKEEIETLKASKILFTPPTKETQVCSRLSGDTYVCMGKEEALELARKTPKHQPVGVSSEYPCEDFPNN